MNTRKIMSSVKHVLTISSVKDPKVNHRKNGNFNNINDNTE